MPTAPVRDHSRSISLPTIAALERGNIPLTAPPQLSAVFLRAIRVRDRLVGAERGLDLDGLRTNARVDLAVDGRRDAGATHVRTRRLEWQPGRPLAETTAHLSFAGDPVDTGRAAGRPGAWRSGDIAVALVSRRPRGGHRQRHRSAGPPRLRHRHGGPRRSTQRHRPEFVVVQHRAGDRTSLQRRAVLPGGPRRIRSNRCGRVLPAERSELRGCVSGLGMDGSAAAQGTGNREQGTEKTLLFPVPCSLFPDCGLAFAIWASIRY